LTNTYVRALAVSGTNLFAGTDYVGVFLSTDNGTSWTEVNTGLTNTYVRAFAVSGTNLFAGTDGGGVFLSTNNGTSWTAVNTGLTNTTVWSLAVSGTNLFAGTYGGVFLSANNGTSWTAVNIGLKNTDVRALAVSATNLFAGTYSGGVWRRPLNELLPVELTFFNATSESKTVVLAWKTATEVNNYGFEVERKTVSSSQTLMTSWQKIGFVQGNGTSNAPHEYSFTDQYHSSGRFVYRLKQLDNDGTFKYSQESEVAIEVPKVFALNQNYPNPFNPATTISFSLSSKSFVSLKVFDPLGREVSILLAEELPAGTYTRQWNGNNLPSGVYFYRLHAGSFTETKKLVLLR
jgi:hypothetical protein